MSIEYQGPRSVRGGAGPLAPRPRRYRDYADDVTAFLEFVRRRKYLLAGIDFDAEPPGLCGLRGDQPLSDDQARLLGAQYDTENLSPPGQYALLRRLAELEVLSAADLRQTQLSVAPGKLDLLGYLADEPEFRDVEEAPEVKPKERLAIMIQNERFASAHVLARYGKRCHAVDRLADSHQKVLDVLKRI